jgi:hypothetical protein
MAIAEEGIMNCGANNFSLSFLTSTNKYKYKYKIRCCQLFSLTRNLSDDTTRRLSIVLLEASPTLVSQLLPRPSMVAT